MTGEAKDYALWFFLDNASQDAFAVDSIGRGSSHNIEVGPYAHDS